MSSTTAADRRASDEAARFANNRSRTAPDVVRETRQQVRSEGRALEARLNANAVAKARTDRCRNGPRRTESMAARHLAHMTAVGWFKRHDMGLSLEAKMEARRAA